MRLQFVTMSFLSDNIRILRDRHRLTQQKTADALKITRGRYVKYEDGSSEPPIDILVRISKFFGVSIDLLLTVDIKKYPLEDLSSLPNNRVILPIMVDARGENKIELVPQRAQMGYLSGYSDPEYIESLQSLSLPFLRHGKYRAFPAAGDSMPPYTDGTYIVGKYVESKDELKEGKTYVFITKTDGIVYKRFRKQNRLEALVSSDNSFYEPYELRWDDVLEIWEFACSINTEEIRSDSSELTVLKDLLLSMKKDIAQISKK